MANRSNQHEVELLFQGSKASGAWPVNELTFWRTCCERGITLCSIPKPMREEMGTWLVEKHPTFIDRTTWVSAYTFDSLDEAFREIERYFSSGQEPTASN
jgi:hypothetical protein